LPPTSSEALLQPPTLFPMPHASRLVPLLLGPTSELQNEHGSPWYYRGTKTKIRHPSYLQSQPGCPKLRAVHVLYTKISFRSTQPEALLL
jgi:hypothetical protein